MKNILIYLPLFVTCLLIAGCEKDDSIPATTIYGRWTTKEQGWITTGRVWEYYTFHQPDYCKFRVEEADGRENTEDSLTFKVTDNTLQIFNKDGTPFGDPAYLEKITTKELKLKYPSGSTKVLYKY